MNKLKAVLGIIGFVAVVYLFLALFMPVVATIANDSANIVAANPNVAAGAYPGAEEGPRIMPLVLWFLPGIAGIVGLVIVLRRGEEGG